MTFTACGHQWRWAWLNDDRTRGSLVCLDPVFDDRGIDCTTWPSDIAVSRHAGRRVVCSDAGDDNDHPEAIYRAED